jgi:phytoene dehydrogenase-like protein
MGSVIRAFDLESGYQLCQGGSFNLARGLMETFIAAGGRYQPQVQIDRILIEGGKATGIVLADGRTVRRAVRCEHARCSPDIREAGRT